MRPRSQIAPLPNVINGADPNLISPGLRGGPLPQLDVNAFTAPARGAADIGEGLQRLGPAMTALYEKKNEADMVNAEFAYKKDLMQTQVDIQAAVDSEPDHSKWAGIAEQQWGAFEQRVDQLPNMPKQAREMIGQSMQLEKIRTLGGLKISAAKQSVNDAEKSISSTVDYAANSGDSELLKTTVDGAVASGFYTPEQGRDILFKGQKRVAAVQENNQWTGIQGQIAQDPEAARKGLEDGSIAASDANRARGLHAAHAAISLQKQGVTDALNAPIASGEWVVPEQVDAYRKEHPEVTDEQAIHAKTAIEKLNKADHNQWVVANADRNISAGMAAVRDYDPNADKDRLEYNRLYTWGVTNLPPGVRDQYLTGLHSRASGKGVEEKDPKMKATVETLNKMETDGQFGPYTTKVHKTVVDDAGVSHAETETVINWRQKAEARDLRVNIETGMRAFMQQHPDATQSEQLTEINRLKPIAIQARALAPKDMGAPPSGFVGPLQGQQKSTVPVRQKSTEVELPKDPGRKAKEKTQEEESIPDTPGVIAQQDTTSDPGDGLPTVDAPGLFPEGGDKTVGGDSMFEYDDSDVTNSSGPSRRKKR